MTTARTSDDMSVTVTPSVARALLSLAGFEQRRARTLDARRWPVDVGDRRGAAVGARHPRRR